MSLTDLLHDVRVVTIAQNLPGPLAVQRLGQRGASITKIEPTAGDPFLTLSEPWYHEMHAGIRVEHLDLKSNEGRARLFDLLCAADLFITSHRPSALARLRLDPETIRGEAPNVRTIRIVGSLANPEEAGHDLTYQAHAGLARETMPLTLAADVMTSERVYSTALELLRQPGGITVDVGLVESLDSLRSPLRHGLTAPDGILGGGAPRYRIYPTSDGHVALAALEPHFERRFYELVALEIGADPSSIFRARATAHWEAWAREHDVPLAAIT